MKVTLELMVAAWTSANADARARALQDLQGVTMPIIEKAGEPSPLLFDAASAARMLSVSKPTIFRWSRLGLLHPVIVAGQKRWPRADLERLSRGGVTP